MDQSSTFGDSALDAAETASCNDDMMSCTPISQQSRIPNKNKLPVPSQVTEQTLTSVQNPETEDSTVSEFLPPHKSQQEQHQTTRKQKHSASTTLITSTPYQDPGPDVPMTALPQTAPVIVDDSADDFLRWKRQFEEEKNNPLGIMDGINSANTTNSATSAQRLMIIGQIQEPEEDHEHPERAYYKKKALEAEQKGLPARFSHGNTIRKHLELVRREGVGEGQSEDSGSGGSGPNKQVKNSTNPVVSMSHRLDNSPQIDPEPSEPEMTEEERKWQEERNKPRGLNEGEKAELMALFEKRKQMSFAALQQKQNKGGQNQLMKGQKVKHVTFELLGVQTFGMQANFAFSEEFLHYMHNNWLVNYDSTTKLWVFTPLEVYHHVFAHCNERFGDKGVDVIPIPPFAMTVMDNPPPFSDRTVNKMLHRYNYAHDRQNKPRISMLPTKLYRQLYNFQKVGVQFAIDHWGRILLGDEMGVGKTIQAIAISYLYRKDWPVLVIVPSSLRFSWRDEIYKWLEGYIPYGAVQVISKNTDQIDMSCSFTIVSYSLAQKLAELIDKMKFQIVIADEAHYMKSRESKRSRSLVPILTKIKRVLLLTGTPMLGKPNEIFNLIKILRPDIFIKFLDFGVRYCNPKESPYGIDWSGNSNNRELHLLLEKALMIRRLKTEVLQELPAKRRQKVSLPIDKRMTNKIQTLLSKVKKFEQKLEADINELQSTLASGAEVDQDTLERMSQKHSSLLQAYAMSGQAKAKGVFAFIETLIDSQVKFLVFAHHYAVLDQLEDQMLKARINYIRIDGRIDVKKRYDAVKKFQNDPKCTVAILSLTASSQGITLTAAQCVVFAEMHWTPGIMIQAEDRAHRIGQASSVTVYYLYGEDTIDSLIYPRLRLKSEVIANVVDGKNDDDTFKIQETRVVSNLKMYDKIETPPPFVPFKNFNNFYEQPNYVDYKKYKQIQYMKRKQAEREELEKAKQEIGGNINQEELNNFADKVVEKGFDKKYDLEQETDSEEHEYDEETDVAMPVIKSLVDYENAYNDQNEAQVKSGKKHTEKYEKTNPGIILEPQQIAECKNMQQMNINDFFFFKPQDLAKKKSFGPQDRTGDIKSHFQDDATMGHDDEKSFLSGNHQQFEEQKMIDELSECDHNSQEFPLPFPALAPRHPDSNYLKRLARIKLRKTNPALFEQLLSISQTQTVRDQQSQSMLAPSQMMMVNSQLLQQTDGVSINDQLSNGITKIEPKSQIIPCASTGQLTMNGDASVTDQTQTAAVTQNTMGLSDAICPADGNSRLQGAGRSTQMMQVQVQDMNSNLIDQKIAEAEQSLLNQIAADTGEIPNEEEDELDSEQEMDTDDMNRLRAQTTDDTGAKQAEEAEYDELEDGDGMSIKWKAFALLRKQFNRIDRQKSATVERRTPQSTMSMMLADFNAVNRLEKQQYLMYLYQMKRRRYYLNGLRMQQANRELMERMQTRDNERGQQDSATAQGTQQTYVEPEDYGNEQSNHAPPVLKTMQNASFLDQQHQANRNCEEPQIKSQMTHHSVLIENESNMTTGFLRDVAGRLQTHSQVQKSDTVAPHHTGTLTTDQVSSSLNKMLNQDNEQMLNPSCKTSVISRYNESEQNQHSVVNQPQQEKPDDKREADVKSNDSEEKARIANEQFMDGMTQLENDDEINETMSRIAEEHSVLQQQQQQQQMLKESQTAAECATGETTMTGDGMDTMAMAQGEVDQNSFVVPCAPDILSQSLLETFNMEQDDQFENLLDDVEVNEIANEADDDPYLNYQCTLEPSHPLNIVPMSEGRGGGTRPSEKDEIKKPMPVLTKFMEEHIEDLDYQRSNQNQYGYHSSYNPRQSNIQYPYNQQDEQSSFQLNIDQKIASEQVHLQEAISHVDSMQIPTQMSSISNCIGLNKITAEPVSQVSQVRPPSQQSSSLQPPQQPLQSTPSQLGQPSQAPTTNQGAPSFKFGKSRQSIKLVKRKKRQHHA